MKTWILLITYLCPVFLPGQEPWLDRSISLQLPPDEVARLEKELAAFYEEDSRSRAALKAQMQELHVAFHRGDFSAIDAAVARKDLPLLWYIAGVATDREIGNHPILWKELTTVEAVVKHKLELSTQVLEYLRPRLSSIPGHAKLMGDRVELMSGTLGLADRANPTGPLRIMGAVGSMECIQQIGRFLNDPRCPKERYFDRNSGMPFPVSNAHAACYDMHRALGASSPLGQPAHIDTRKFGLLRAWWDSDAARPYREWNYEDYEPMPPPRKRAVSLRPPAAKSLSTAGNPGPASSLNIPAIWPVLAIITLGALAAVLGFTKLRRG
ncbi:MAG: hypothetical protein U1F81_15745 [Verrucomicrobiaceae bacterium]